MDYNATSMNKHVLDTTKKYPKEDDLTGQFQLGIKPRKFQPFRAIKRKVRSLETKLEIMPFWRNFSFVFMLLSSICFPAIMVIIMVYYFNDLPSKIPVFYDTQSDARIGVDKGLAVLLPIFVGISNLILLNMLHSIFHFDRRLAQVISFSINIGNILLIIAFVQIISLSLL